MLSILYMYIHIYIYICTFCFRSKQFQQMYYPFEFWIKLPYKSTSLTVLRKVMHFINMR